MAARSAVPAEAVQTSPPPSPRPEAKAKLEDLIRRHQLNVIAIGNGTACRETEEIVSELIAEKLADLVRVGL